MATTHQCYWKLSRESRTVKEPLTEQNEDVEGRICICWTSKVVRAMIQREVWHEITENVADGSEFHYGRAQSHYWESEGVQ